MKNFLILLCFLFGKTYYCIPQTNSSYQNYLNSINNVNIFDQTNELNKDIVSDGSISIDEASQNLLYSYPIHSYSSNNSQVSITLDYNANIQFTSFSYGDIDAKWKMRTENKPLWMVGVNGFVVSAFNFVGSNFNDPTMHTQISPLSSNSQASDIHHAYFNPVSDLEEDLSGDTDVFWYNNQNIIWLVNGYDINTKLSTTNSEYYYNEINILKTNGSILRLKSQKNSPIIDQNGKTLYYEVGENKIGYALISYLDDQCSDSTNTNIYDGINRQRKRRKVEYYSGDGFKYVFREYLHPYGEEISQYGFLNESQLLGGIDHTQYQIVVNGLEIRDNTLFPVGGTQGSLANESSVDAHTIFYLDEVWNEVQKICDLSYERHNICNDGTIGRSIVTKIEDTKFHLTKGGLDNGTLALSNLDLEITTPTKFIDVDLPDIQYNLSSNSWTDSAYATIYGLGANCDFNQLDNRMPDSECSNGNFDNAFYEGFRALESANLYKLISQGTGIIATPNSDLNALPFMCQYKIDDFRYHHEYTGNYDKDLGAIFSSNMTTLRDRDGNEILNAEGNPVQKSFTENMRYIGVNLNVKSITELPFEDSYFYSPEFTDDNERNYDNNGLIKVQEKKITKFEYEEFHRDYDMSSFSHSLFGIVPKNWGFPRSVGMRDKDRINKLRIEDVRLKGIHDSGKYTEFEYFDNPAGELSLNVSSENLEYSKALYNMVKSKKEYKFKNDNEPQRNTTYSFGSNSNASQISLSIDTKDNNNIVDATDNFTITKGIVFKDNKRQHILTQSQGYVNAIPNSDSSSVVLDPSNTLNNSVRRYYHYEHLLVDRSSLKNNNVDYNRYHDLCLVVERINNNNNGDELIINVKTFENIYSYDTRTKNYYVSETHTFEWDQGILSTLLDNNNQLNFDPSDLLEEINNELTVEGDHLSHLKSHHKTKYKHLEDKQNQNYPGDYINYRIDHDGSRISYLSRLSIGQYHNFNRVTLPPEGLENYPNGLSFDESLCQSMSPVFDIERKFTNTNNLYDGYYQGTFRDSKYELYPAIIKTNESYTTYESGNNIKSEQSDYYYLEDHVDNYTNKIKYGRINPYRVINETTFYDPVNNSIQLENIDTLDIEYSTGWVAGRLPEKIKVSNNTGNHLPVQYVNYVNDWMSDSRYIDIEYPGIYMEPYNSTIETRPSIEDFKSILLSNTDGIGDEDILPCNNMYLPTGKILSNDGVVFREKFPITRYDYVRSKPAAEILTTRYYDPNTQNVVNNQLIQVSQYDYNGNRTGHIDYNGWIRRYNYDSYGLFKQMNLPGDFNNPADLSGYTTCNPRNEEILLPIDNTIQYSTFRFDHSYTCSNQNIPGIGERYIQEITLSNTRIVTDSGGDIVLYDKDFNYPTIGGWSYNTLPCPDFNPDCDIENDPLCNPPKDPPPSTTPETVSEYGTTLKINYNSLKGYLAKINEINELKMILEVSNLAVNNLFTDCTLQFDIKILNTGSSSPTTLTTTINNLTENTKYTLDLLALENEFIDVFNSNETDVQFEINITVIDEFTLVNFDFSQTSNELFALKLSGDFEYVSGNYLASDFMRCDFTERFNYQYSSFDFPQYFLNTTKHLRKIDDINSTVDPNIFDNLANKTRVKGTKGKRGFENKPYESKELLNSDDTYSFEPQSGSPFSTKLLTYNFLNGKEKRIEDQNRPYNLPDNLVNELKYLSDGSLYEQVDNKGQSTNYYKDYFSLPSTDYPELNQISDKFDNDIVVLNTVIAPAGKIIKSFENLKGEVVRTYEYNKNTTSERTEIEYTYDPVGNLISTENLLTNEIHRFWYDEKGNKICDFLKEGGYTTYAYDSRGNLRFKQTQKQADLDELTFFEYDDLNRLVLKGSCRINTDPSILSQAQTTLPGRAYSPNDPVQNGVYMFTRLTDILNPDMLHDAFTSSVNTVNQTVWDNRTDDGWINYNVPVGDIAIEDKLPNTISETNKQLQMQYDIPNKALHHVAHHHDEFSNDLPFLNLHPDHFEHIGWSPNSVESVKYYDRMPFKNGMVWRWIPDMSILNAMTPNGKFENQKGRLAAEAYRSSNKQPYSYRFYSYDALGRVDAEVKITDNIGFESIYYSYNSLGLIVTKTVIDADKRLTTWYEYDDYGRLKDVYSKMDNEGHKYVKTSVSGNLNPPTVAPPASLPTENTEKDISYVYGDGTLSSLKHIKLNDEEIVHTFEYDELGNVEDHNILSNYHGPLYSLNQSYNALQQLENKSWTIDGKSFYSDLNYDGKNRLVSNSRLMDNLLVDDITYQYDNAGRRTSHSSRSYISQILSPPNTQYDFLYSYLYDQNTDRLRYYHVNEANHANGNYKEVNMQYYSDGALKSRQISRLKTSTLHQPYKEGERKAEYFVYDDNKRLQKYFYKMFESPDMNTLFSLSCDQPLGSDLADIYDERTEFQYIYDQNGLREQKRLYYDHQMEINNDIHYPWEYTSREVSGTVNAIYHGYEFDKVTYTDWADQEVTIDKIPMNYESPSPYSQHFSNRSVFMYPVEYMVYGQAASPLVKYKFNGSTEQWEKEFQILDLSGNELMQYRPGTIHIEPVTVENLSYGEKRWVSNERSDWSAWLGNHDDVESRLSDFNARLYDPDIGMFLAVDELWAEQPGWNPYHYAMNNPIMYEDRSGYLANFVWGGLIGGGVELGMQLMFDDRVYWDVVLASSVAGALSSGLSVSGTIGRRMLINGGINTVHSLTTQHLKGEDLSFTQTAKDVTIGSFFDYKTFSVYSENSIDVLENSVDRVRRINSNPNKSPRASRINKEKELVNELNNMNRTNQNFDTVLDATGSSASSRVFEALEPLPYNPNSSFNNTQRDNTNIPIRIQR